MAIPIYSTLVHYSTPPNSYIGAFIFLSYIVLALYATLSITYSLYTQYTNIYHNAPPPKDESAKAAHTARARHIKIYAFLASLSFATLSYHMLSFLITHYLAWSRATRRQSPAALSPQSLGAWMLESTLFQDFASDLVQDVPNALWTQLAILATWFWNVWMAAKARQISLPPQKTRTFILLSQILPISLTACLFVIQLHLFAAASSSQNPSSPSPSSSSETNTKSEPQHEKPLASLHIPSTLLNLLLLAQPSLRHNQISNIMLFAERFILLLPHTGLVNLRRSDVNKCVYVASGFVVANWMRGRKDAGLGDVLGALGHGGYAVKALGWDAVLGGVVYMVLGWGGGI